MRTRGCPPGSYQPTNLRFQKERNANTLLSALLCDYNFWVRSLPTPQPTTTEERTQVTPISNPLPGYPPGTCGDPREHPGGQSKGNPGGGPGGHPRVPPEVTPGLPPTDPHKSGNHKAGLKVKESRGFRPEIVGWLVRRSPGDSHEKPPNHGLRNSSLDLRGSGLRPPPCFRHQI